MGRVSSFVVDIRLVVCVIVRAAFCLSGLKS